MSGNPGSRVDDAKIVLRLSEVEREMLRRGAAQRGVTMSAYVRALVAEAAARLGVEGPGSVDP